MRKRILFFMVIFGAQNVYAFDCPEGYDLYGLNFDFLHYGGCMKIESIQDENPKIVNYVSPRGDNYEVKYEYYNDGKIKYMEMLSGSSQGTRTTWTYDGNKVITEGRYANGSGETRTHIYDEEGQETNLTVDMYKAEGEYRGSDVYRFEYDDNGDSSYDLITYNKEGIPVGVEGNLYSVEDGKFYEYTYTWQEDEDGNLTGGQKIHDYTGEVLEIFSFDEDGNMLVYDPSDENLERPKAKYGVFGEMLESYEYDANGKRTAYDKNGKKIRGIMKRIYTVEEATRLSKPTGNKFMIRYK